MENGRFTKDERKALYEMIEDDLKFVIGNNEPIFYSLCITSAKHRVVNILTNISQNKLCDYMKIINETISDGDKIVHEID